MSDWFHVDVCEVQRCWLLLLPWLRQGCAWVDGDVGSINVWVVSMVCARLRWG